MSFLSPQATEQAGRNFARRKREGFGFMAEARAAFDLAEVETASGGPSLLFLDELNNSRGALARDTGNPERFRPIANVPFGVGQGDALDDLRGFDDKIAAINERDGTEWKTAAEIEERAATEVDRRRLAAEASGFAASAVGGIGSAFTDPVVAPTLLLGAYAPASVLRVALVEGLAGIAGEGAVQAGNVLLETELRKTAGIDVTPGQALGAVALAGVGGAAIGGALAKAGQVIGRRGSRTLVDTVDRLVDEGKVNLTPDQIVARDAVARQAETLETAPIQTPAGLAAHAEAITEAKGALKAGQPPDPSRAYARLGRLDEEAIALADAQADLPEGLAGRRLEELAERREGEIPDDAAFSEEPPGDPSTLDEPPTSFREPTQADEAAIALADAQADQAAGLRTRTVDNTVMDLSAKGEPRPFGTRKAAQEFGERTFPGQTEVVKVGRGWGVVEAETPTGTAGREAFNDVNDAATTRQDAYDAERGRDAELATSQRELDRAVEQTRGPQTEADRVETEVDTATAEQIDAVEAPDDPDVEIQLTQDDGSEFSGTVGEFVDEMDEQASFVKAVRDCMVS